MGSRSDTIRSYNIDPVKEGFVGKAASNLALCSFSTEALRWFVSNGALISTCENRLSIPQVIRGHADDYWSRTYLQRALSW